MVWFSFLANIFAYQKKFIPQFINSNANCAVCKGTLAYSSIALNFAAAGHGKNHQSAVDPSL